MPCYESGPSCTEIHLSETLSNVQDKLRKKEAFLCGLLTLLTKKGLFYLIEELDFQEMGIPKQEILDWWLQHQQTDKYKRTMGEDK